MNISGQHLILDAYECNADILNDRTQLEDMIKESIYQLGMEILTTNFYSSSPQGVTGVMGLSTSHFTIHTWPETEYAALDLFTCGDENIWSVLHAILYRMGAKRAVLYELSRGFETGPTPEVKKLTISSDNRLLNERLQFCSKDELFYHEALVFPAMEISPSHERVLILGGGDGMTLQEVLKYPTVKHVDFVSIDPLLMEKEDFVGNERVQVHREDVKSYLTKGLSPYNVIIIDFPEPIDSKISTLYTKELFRQIARLLWRDGILVCPFSRLDQAPKTFWSIGKTLKKSGFRTTAFYFPVEPFGSLGFHLGAHKKITTKIPRISVPHTALPTNLDSLFQIPSIIISEQKSAIVNSLSSLRLREFYQKERLAYFKKEE